MRFFFVAGRLQVPKGCLRGARFARDENLGIFENQKKNRILIFDRSQHLKWRPGHFLSLLGALEKLKLGRTSCVYGGAPRRRSVAVIRR